jgi:hypothetical protein
MPEKQREKKKRETFSAKVARKKPLKKKLKRPSKKLKRMKLA